MPRTISPLDAFHAPHVTDAPVERFEEHGLGQQPNNVAAIASLTGCR
jgi:alkaline phosphatase D